MNHNSFIWSDGNTIHCTPSLVGKELLLISTAAPPAINADNQHGKSISFGGTKWKDSVNITYAYIKVGNIFNHMIWTKAVPYKFHFIYFFYSLKHVTLTYYRKVTHLLVGALGCCVMPDYMYIQWNTVYQTHFFFKTNHISWMKNENFLSQTS